MVLTAGKLQKTPKDYSEIDKQQDILAAEYFRNPTPELEGKLYISLEPIARGMCRRFALSSGRLTAEDLFDRIGKDALRTAIHYFDPGRGRPISRWTFFVLKRKIVDYIKRRSRQPDISLEEFYDPEDLGISGRVESPEDEIVGAIDREKLQRSVRASIALSLNPREREVIRRAFGHGETHDEIAEDKCSRQRIGQISLAALKKLEPILEDADKIMDKTPEECACLSLFPSLDYKTNTHAFSRAGIEFSSDGELTLTSLESNIFNVTLFTHKNGARVSGRDLLQAAKVFSLEELVDKADQEYLKHNKSHEKPERDSESDFSKEEVLAAVRDYENLERLIQLLSIRHDEKWHVAAAARDFKRPWCALDTDDLSGGYKLLKLLGLPITQQGIEVFFRMVFGEDQLVFVKGKKGVANLVEKYGEESNILELRNQNNEEVWKQSGIRFEDDKCHICINIEDIRDYLSFSIRNRKVNLRTLLEWFGLPETIKGFAELCKQVFPDKQILLWKFTNGVSMEQPSEDEIINELKKPLNKAVLRSLVKRDASGKLVVDIRRDSLKGQNVSLFGRNNSLCTVFDKMLGQESKQYIEKVYREIFGDEVANP